jgi:hypothetical protein
MPFEISVHVQPDYVQAEYPFSVSSRIINDSEEATEPFAIHYKVTPPNGVDTGFTLFKHHRMDPHEEWEEEVMSGVTMHEQGLYRFEVALFQDNIPMATGALDIVIH